MPWMGEWHFISVVFTTYNISNKQYIGSCRHLIYINKDICIYLNILRKHRMFLYSYNLATHNEIYLSIIFLTSNVSVQISILYLFDFSIFSKKGELSFWKRVLHINTSSKNKSLEIYMTLRLTIDIIICYLIRIMRLIYLVCFHKHSRIQIKHWHPCVFFIEWFSTRVFIFLF